MGEGMTPSKDLHRGMRGGSFYHSARSCRSASLFRYLPYFQSWYGGFRPVAEVRR